MRYFILLTTFCCCWFTLNADINEIIDGNINEEVIATSNNNISYPTDLDFNPNPERPNELWVLNHGLEDGGTTVMITDPGSSSAKYDHRKDGNAWHFMVFASAIAMGDTAFATAQDYFNANRDGGGAWCGPSLWPSDLDIYAVIGNPPNNQNNGSHYDMLHQSPYSSGIAHEKNNVYWINDGLTGTISRYDFAAGHYPGGHDHSDGSIFRHVDVPYEMNAGIPAHMVIKDNWLYYVNPGTKSINRLNINSGTEGNSLASQSNRGESHEKFVEMNNTEWETVIDNGLVHPSGIEIYDNYLIVSDNYNGEIVIYDMNNSFEEVKRLKTGARSIMGVITDNDGNIYYVDNLDNTVVKIEGNPGIFIYTENTFLNLENGNNTTSLIIENNSDQELEIQNLNATINEIAESNDEPLSTSVDVDMTSTPILISPGESLEVDLNIDNTGLGVSELRINTDYSLNSEQSSINKTVSLFSKDIPLMYVFDGSPNNEQQLNIENLLNGNGYSNYIRINSLDFQQFAYKFDGLKTLIWNVGVGGSLNAQEYSKLFSLLDNTTSVYLLGDLPYIFAAQEQTFDLSHFGVEYGGNSFQGFQNSGNYRLEGVSGDPISDGYSNIPARITPLSNDQAVPAQIFIPNSNNSNIVFHQSIDMDTSLVVRHENDDRRSVIMGLNYFNITDNPDKNNVFKSITDWLTYKDATGIFELAGYDGFEVYPNPAVEYIKVDEQELKPKTQIEILDIAGKKLRDINYSDSEINISNLQSGAYFLMLKNDNEIKVSKFIKK